MANATTYILRRIGRLLVMTWAVVTVVFIAFRLVPGDPVAMLAAGGGLTEETRQEMIQQFGLNEPVHVQYFLFIKNILFEQSLGVSYYYRSPVLDIIIPKFINTLLLMIPAFFLMLVVAYFVGAYLGWNNNSRVDRVGSMGSVALRSVPHFVLGMFLLIIFSYQLGWFPTGGMFPGQAQIPGPIERLFMPQYYVAAFLPFVTVAFHWFADPFLLMRGNIIDQKHKEYVRLHRLKGLSEKQVRRHAAANSKLPMVSYASTLINIAFSGVVLVEVVFSWPGIGREIVDSTFRRDFPVVQGAFLIIAFAIIFSNFIIDLLYGYWDPRIEYGDS